MYMVVCCETRASCSHKNCAFIVNFDGGFCFNGGHAAAESIVKICFPVKWTSVAICLESVGICTERITEVGGMLLGGY